MDGSIYDLGWSRTALGPFGDTIAPPSAPSRFKARAARRTKLVGLIANPRSHRNGGRSRVAASGPNLIHRTPSTFAELHEALQLFARRGIDILAIDGGDGTVRDVLTCAEDLWGASWPDIVILPTGKTNALAIDMGVPDWTLDEALDAAARGSVTLRSPIEIRSAAGTGMKVRGFIFGTGAFVDATALAQRTHRAGAFNGIAVGLALTWGIAQTLFGGANSSWRAGNPMHIAYGPGAVRMHGATPDGVDRRYLLLASTLHRLPIGLRPFGTPRPGLKTLVVDAPPRKLAMMIGPLLGGSESRGLERRGYHRVDAPRLTIDLASNFVLDGETFPSGAYHVSEGQPLRFIVA